MSQPFEIVLRSVAGNTSRLTVTEIVEIDGKPYNGNQSEDLQVCMQAIRHLEGRLDQMDSLLTALVTSSNKESL